MIDIGSSTGHKIGILLVLTTLTIGSISALTIEEPTTDDVFGTEIQYNISAEGYDNVTVEIDGPASKTRFYDSSNSSLTEGWVNDTYDPGDNSGEYTVTAYAVESDGTEQEDGPVEGIIYDNQEPEIIDRSPSEDAFVSESSPTVNAEFSDVNTEVENTNLSLVNSDGDVLDFDFSQSSNPELNNFDDLQSGDTYTIEYYANDTVGNVLDNSWDFTVDTSYDGDSDPSFSVEDESSGVVLFNGDKDLTVDFGDADSTSDTTVECYVAGENVDSFTVSEGDGNQDYTCEIDHDDDADYYDASSEIYLAMEDAAGNTGESDEDTVAFDVNPPSVSGLEIPTNADLYNSNFDVEFSAFDSASDVEEVEYYFESSTSAGEGTSFDSVDQDSYEIDTSELSEGDHTLYVRARDEADRWSTAETVDFSFDPDAVPEISLDVPQNVSVTAGEQGSFEVTVENTGDLHISSIELNGSSGDFFSDDESISDLEPGESITAPMEIDTESNNLGEHTIEVSTDNPSMSESIDLVVEANTDQQSQIDSDLSEYQSRLQKIEANVTSLKKKVSEGKKKRLNSNFSVFKQKVEDAQSAVESGDYYKAESILEGVDQDYSAAESSYKTVHKEYKNNQFWMFVFLGLGGVIVLGGGAIGALSYSDEVDFDVRDYLEDLQELEFDGGFFEKYADKFKRLLEGKDTSDAEDFKWDGFNNN